MKDSLSAEVGRCAINEERENSWKRKDGLVVEVAECDLGELDTIPSSAKPFLYDTS